MKKVFLGFLLGTSIITNASAGECNVKSLDNIFSLMAKRNTLMVGVAAYKFAQNQYIYDAAREVEVLKNVQQVAANNKLNPNDLMLFSQAQMDQAKLIQATYLDYWKKNPADQPDPSITPGISSLRTQINKLDDQIYAGIVANSSQISICSQDIMLKHLNAAYAGSNTMKVMSSVAIDYNKIIVSALSNISPAGE